MKVGVLITLKGQTLTYIVYFMMCVKVGKCAQAVNGLSIRLHTPPPHNSREEACTLEISQSMDILSCSSILYISNTSPPPLIH